MWDTLRRHWPEYSMEGAGLGLFMVSLNPTSVDVQKIVLGNILAVSPEDLLQLFIICAVSMTILALKWKDLMASLKRVG